MKRARHRGDGAFTLVELLVVMGIIALLFSIMIPAIGSARQAAAVSQARRELNDIVTAFRSYFGEYGRYPLQDGDRDQVYSDEQYRLAIDMLRGGADDSDMNTHNPRRMVFLSVNQKSLNNEGVFVDPWRRNRYQVAADWRNDGRIIAGQQGHAIINGRTVIAWSWGQRGQTDQNNSARHIKSWEN